jgi:Mg-chelatase subunit ChlD
MGADETAKTTPTSDDVVHVQIVLDRSGSMAPIAAATVDALNGLLAKQRAHPGLARLSLADFDSQEPFRVVIDAVPIAEVLDLDEADFQPRGGTPLFDAIGRAVERCDVRAAESPDEDQVLVVITDGHENASTDYTGPAVSNLLDVRQESGWSVLFLGANQDSFATADALKMKQGNVRDFDATPQGIHDAVDLAATAVYDQRTRSKPERRAAKDMLLDEAEGDRG